jgi:4-carboxymuconolactone decarboxylase
MRLEKLTPEDMSPRQRELSDRITARRGQTRGPFLVWLHSPGLCDRVEALGAYVRFETALPLKLRELGLLIAARFWDAQYSWNAHVDKAVEAGISRSALDAIAEHREPNFEQDDEATFYRFCMEVLADHFVSDETFARAHALFGSEGLVDTIGVLGNFSMLAMCLNTFQVDLQADRPPPFPDIRGYEPPAGRPGMI